MFFTHLWRKDPYRRLFCRAARHCLLDFAGSIAFLYLRSRPSTAVVITPNSARGEYQPRIETNCTIYPWVLVLCIGWKLLRRSYNQLINLIIDHRRLLRPRTCACGCSTHIHRVRCPLRRSIVLTKGKLRAMRKSFVRMRPSRYRAKHPFTPHDFRKLQRAVWSIRHSSSKTVTEKFRALRPEMMVAEALEVLLHTSEMAASPVHSATATATWSRSLCRTCTGTTYTTVCCASARGTKTAR
jgi:hypothetical protein